MLSANCELWVIVWLMMEDIKTLDGFARAKDNFIKGLSDYDQEKLSENLQEGLVSIALQGIAPPLNSYLELMNAVRGLFESIAHEIKRNKNFWRLSNFYDRQKLEEMFQINQQRRNAWEQQLQQIKTVHENIKQNADKAQCMRFDSRDGNYPHDTGIPGIPIKYIYE
jgi:hypothetical protein